MPFDYAISKNVRELHMIRQVSVTELYATGWSRGSKAVRSRSLDAGPSR